MRLRLPKRHSGTPGLEALLAHLPQVLDRSIPWLRTLFMVAGLLAAALRPGRSADFLFATGLLFQCAIWFEHWWKAKRTR